MNGNSTRAVAVEAGGDQVVAHVGLHALGRFADRLGLGDALSVAFPARGERLPVHDRGKVLVHSMLMLAAGGGSCADVEHLRVQERLFGSVASDSTTYRVLRYEATGQVLAAVAEALAPIRHRVWDQAGLTSGDGMVVLDVDASLTEVHSENKELAAATYKSGFGFHDMFCFADATGECLSALMRSGNAGANTIADHVTVLDAAIGQLPEEIARGHREGDDPALATRKVQVRTDSAGCTGFVHECAKRNIGFAVVARSNTQVHAAISRAIGDGDRWQPAIRQDGEPRKGAQVAELSDLVDLSDWPKGTRLVVRREPLHPGAQQSLFPSLNYRYWGHYTDAEGDPVELDRHMRAHAHVEQNIRRLKTTGATRRPFTKAAANQAWLTVAAMADALVRWFQQLCVTGPLARAEPTTLRWKLWHTPARIIHTASRDIIRILDGWPDTQTILTAYQHAQLTT